MQSAHSASETRWWVRDPAVQTVAVAVLTPPQLAVWTRHADGLSLRAISYELDLARSTVADRFDAVPPATAARAWWPSPPAAAAVVSHGWFVTQFRDSEARTCPIRGAR